MTLKSLVKFEEKLTCGLENDIKKFGKFSPEQSNVSELGLWQDSFVQSRKCMSLKLTEELCVMTWKLLQNLKRNWLFASKLTWRICLILTRPLKNLKKLLFNGLLWPNYIMFELKRYRGGMFNVTEDLCKIWRKTGLCFQKWHFANFHKFLKFSQAIAISL